jgi:hypothetical protein
MSIVSEKAEKEFASHTTIGMVVEGLVHGNAFFDRHQHNRETLDDLISDLCQYRRSLPSTKEYMESGRIK